MSLSAVKHLIIAALMLAHSWYPQECCHDKECRPVPCAELHYDGDSVRYGRIYFSKRMIRQSGMSRLLRRCGSDNPLCAVVRFRPASDELNAMIADKSTTEVLIELPVSGNQEH